MTAKQCDIDQPANQSPVNIIDIIMMTIIIVCV